MRLSDGRLMPGLMPSLQLLALHAALKVLINDPLASCAWIDTGGGFDPQRAKGVLESWNVDVSE